MDGKSLARWGLVTCGYVFGAVTWVFRTTTLCVWLPLVQDFFPVFNSYIRLLLYMFCCDACVYPCTHWQVSLLALLHCVRVIAVPPRGVVTVGIEEKQVEVDNWTTWATNSWTRSGVTTIFQQQFTIHSTGCTGSTSTNTALRETGASEPLTSLGPPAFEVRHDIHSSLMDIFPHDRPRLVPWMDKRSSGHFIQPWLVLSTTQVP